MSEKKFQGAPFGTQKSRFDVNGIHPKSKLPGSLTQIGHEKRYMNSESRKLGPGSYNIENGCFSAKAVKERASGPGWERAYITSQEAKMPHLLYREEWERKQLQKEMTGPGTYDIRDYFSSLQTKPGSKRGVCATLSKRFPQRVEETPGPGTYGEGGNPHANMEAKRNKSFSTVGFLDAGSSSKRQLPEVGCALCPGQYESKSFTDILKDKAVTERGPYDLFSADRNKPISTGHYAQMTRANLGPGEYPVKSFLDEWSEKHKENHGRFGKMTRYPSVPSERLGNCTLTQWPRKSDDPGPGQYNPFVTARPEVGKRQPFSSTSTRTDRNARKFFMATMNPVGPGRYSFKSESLGSHGHKSMFDSKSKRWDPMRDRLLMERIRSKDVPVKDRVFILPLSA